MKKIFSFAVIIAFSFLVYTKFVEAAYALGFVKYYKVTELESSSQDRVECNTWAFGIIDETDLEEEYQNCIADYQKQGYQVVSQQGT